jgi:hypothetical protein
MRDTGMIYRQEERFDWRDHLLGEPIHNGDFLKLSVDGDWVRVRYETHGRQAYVVFQDGSKQDITDAMIFYWPVS